MKTEDTHFKETQRTFYDSRYSVTRRALNKFSNILMLSYDKKLIQLITCRFGKSKVLRVLEVGAGQGSDAVLLSETCANVIAIDLSKSALKTAKTLSRLTKCEDKVSVVQADAENLPFKDASYDAVYSRDVLHHVSNSVLSVKEMKRVAKETATVVAVEANGLNPQMIAIGLLYFSVDRGVLRNTSDYLSNIFMQAGLRHVQVTETEFFPRHVLFEYRSPLNRLLVPKSPSFLKFLSDFERIWQRLSFLSKFSNYLVVSAPKSQVCT